MTHVAPKMSLGQGESSGRHEQRKTCWMAQQIGERRVDSYFDGYESTDSEDEFDDTQYGTMVRTQERAVT